MLLLYSTYFTIDQGERGVILHWGAIAGEAEPGLHFKIPVVTTVEKISVQIQKLPFEKTTQGDYRMESYSRDQQPAMIALSVNYHVTDVSAIYAQYGSLGNMETRIISPKAFEQLKNRFRPVWTPTTTIQKRAALNAQVYNAIRGAIRGPVVIDSVQIEDISFSQQYEAAVEARACRPSSSSSRPKPTSRSASSMPMPAPMR